MPVCVCDGRTILFCPVLGVFCDNDARDNNNNDANSQIIVVIVHTQEAEAANVGGPVVAEEIILCSFKKALYSVLLYCECARLCFLRRTHARTDAQSYSVRY